MISWFDGYSQKVSNLTLNEFRNLVIYRNLSDWTPNFHREDEIEKMYMETQGNYDAYHKTCEKWMNMYQS